MNDKTQIDLMLTVVENPIRRRIIKRLSQDPSYPLEIAKELGIGQQLVTTHLAMMERDGFVASSMETSPLGPKRRLYFLKQSAYLTVSFGPHLYTERFFTFENLPSKLSENALTLLDRIAKIQQSKASGGIVPLSNLVADIDGKLTELEDEKTVLLYIRNLAMKQASDVLDTQEKTHDEKRVLHFILDERSKDIESISKNLNLRESAIRSILEKIKKELPNI